MGLDNLWSQTLLSYQNQRIIPHEFLPWNYNCALYYYYLIMEKIYKINKRNILHS
jgi:hypothetical protein